MFSSLRTQEGINRLSDGLVDMSCYAAAGYVCAYVAKATPSHGAVFGAVSYLVSELVDPFFKSVFAGPNANASSKLVGRTLSIITGVAASAAISSIIGFSITFQAGLVLSCALVIMKILGAYFLKALTDFVEDRKGHSFWKFSV